MREGTPRRGYGSWQRRRAGREKACHLAHQELLGRIDGTPVDIVGFESNDRAGHIALLDCTIADHDDIIEKLHILGEGDGGGDGGRGEDLRRIADATHLDLGRSAGGLQDEVAVQAGGDTVVGAFFDDRSADNRPLGIYDDAFNLITALGGNCRA